MKAIFTLLAAVILIALSFGTAYSQQVQETVVNNNIIWNSNNTQDPNDMTDMPVYRAPTQEETDLQAEIRRLRSLNDESLRGRIEELNTRLDALNPQMMRAPGFQFYDGTVGQGGNNPPFTPDVIGNKEIFNSGTKVISAIATATETRGTTAGRIWVALAWRTTSSKDTIRLYYSANNGASWTFYGWGALGGTDRINFEDMDMEIIEPASGEKYIYITFGYRLDAGTGRWRTGGLIFRSPTFAANFFTLSWPGDNATNRYYNVKLTSDNFYYPTAAYVFFIASFDTTAASGHNNQQRIARITSPYTTTPTISYKAGNLFWQSGTIADNIIRDLHSDIAFFRHTNDSLITSFSNIRDSSKVFFSKTSTSIAAASPTGAGGPIGGTVPTLHKQNGALASNSNDNGRIVFVYRVNESPWNIRYMRTENWGNFNSLINSAPIGSTYFTNYGPYIAGVRGAITSYLTFTTNASVDSVQFVRIYSGFTYSSRRMNAVTALSGTVMPRPGFRNVNNDSCFVIYCPTGPYDVWAAYGCSGAPVGIRNTETPVKFGLYQNYPNPFNPSTSIRFDIPKEGLVKLVVYDVLGREVAAVINEVKEAGSYIVDFNAAGLTSGIYFYKLTSGSFTEIKKMMLLK